MKHQPLTNSSNQDNTIQHRNQQHYIISIVCRLLLFCCVVPYGVIAILLYVDVDLYNIIYNI